MVNFEKFELENGLRVLVHRDSTTPMAVVNVLYDVGARDENPEQTGFAHLFEHLMFGGSIHIPSYDEPLQMAGGENNAYTTNDLTNYYCQLPLENIETALWLESDRMLSLAFDPVSLEVQKKVVVEEFKEHYINKPYGDVWHKIRELSYTKHPYRWMTIGKELKHIEDASLDDVKQFFFKHYHPANAILAIGGNISTEHAKELAEKWFGDIPAGPRYERKILPEPKQQAPRFREVQADVPFDALYKSWHMASRLEPEYYTADLITEILGNGSSSRLYQSLVKEQQLFSSISCSHTGSIDPGIVVISGKLVEGVSIEKGEEGIQHVLEQFQQEKVSETELQKVKNRVESLLAFEDLSLMNRVNNLANYELLGNAALMNEELKYYQRVTSEDIQNYSRELFAANNCNTLYYRSSQQKLTTHAR